MEPVLTTSVDSYPHETNMAEEFNDNSFEDEVKRAKEPVLVNFYAHFDRRSEEQARIMDMVARDYKDRVKIGKVDIPNNPRTVDQEGVRAVAALAMFKNGERVDEIDMKTDVYPEPMVCEFIDRNVS